MAAAAAKVHVLCTSTAPADDKKQTCRTSTVRQIQMMRHRTSTSTSNTKLQYSECRAEVLLMRGTRRRRLLV